MTAHGYEHAALHMKAAVRAAAAGDRNLCRTLLDRYVDMQQGDVDRAVFVAAYAVAGVIHDRIGNIWQVHDEDAPAGLAAALVGASGLHDPEAGWDVWRRHGAEDRVSAWVLVVMTAGDIIRGQAEG